MLTSYLMVLLLFLSQGVEQSASSSDSSEPAPSISSLSTDAWRSKYEKDGTVDLWMEEEFNSGSRLVVGAAGKEGRRSL